MHAVLPCAWRKSMTFRRLLLGAPAGLAPAGAFAHSFSAPYVLPVPLSIYVYACAATLILSFALLGVFLVNTGGVIATHRPDGDSGATQQAGGRWSLLAGRALALGCLLLTLFTAAFGTRDPAANVAMTLFWVFFLLGLTYLCAFAGDIYSLINPWETLLDWAKKLGFDTTTPPFAYPRPLGSYPAFAFYVALIWLEIFILPKPAYLAVALAAYTVVTFAGTWCFGRAAWFRHADLFAVFFRLISTLAPLEYTLTADRTRVHVRRRRMFSGMVEERPEHISAVLFVFFMLSSTTYDAIHGTYFWQSVYWKGLLSLLQPLWGGDMLAVQSGLMDGYEWYQRLGLLLSPLLYVLIFFVILAWTRVLTRVSTSVKTLALQFAYSLIPIALVYNATHYYTFLAAQVRNVPWFITDPIGQGWDLLGIGHQAQAAPLNMAVIWHVQVALILIGHMISVYVAHVIALHVFPTRRQAIVSQLPLLLLMVAYTGIGLWVLSLATIPPGTGSAG